MVKMIIALSFITWFFSCYSDTYSVDKIDQNQLEFFDKYIERINGQIDSLNLQIARDTGNFSLIKKRDSLTVEHENMAKLRERKRQTVFHNGWYGNENNSNSK